MTERERPPTNATRTTASPTTLTPEPDPEASRALGAPAFDAHVEAVVRLVHRDPHVSLVEVERLLASRGIAVTGEAALAVGGVARNIILWVGASSLFVDIVRAALDSERIHIAPASLLTYLCDGKFPRLPIVTRAVRYKTPHWLPVVFNPGPQRLPRLRRARAAR